MRIAIFVALAAVGCGGEPGTITVVADGITGSQGLLLISEARNEDGNQAAISCIPITSDPFDSTEVLEEIVGPTPCEESDPIELDPGVYDILTVTMMGGETDPRSCAEAEVEVDGDVTVEMPALGACD